MREQHRYLYGAIRADEPKSFGAIGIDGRDVWTTTAGPIAMITGPVDHGDFSRLPPQEALRYLTEHQRVLEHVMRESTVVPVKFGTVVEDDEQLSGVLAAGREAFDRALDRLAGKVELDVAVSWVDLRAILAEIAVDPAVVSMKARMASEASPTLEQRIQLGQVVKQFLDKKSEAVASRLVAALKAQWPDVIVTPTRDDSVVLNAAVLIDRVEEDQFDQAVGKLNCCYQNRLHFRCVGPLPPHSFATVDVKCIGTTELDAARQGLELGESASLAEIKAAHRRLLRKHHPDGNPDPLAAERVKEISAAYEVLEEYTMNVKHTFHPAAQRGGIIVKVKSLPELHQELSARAA